MANRSDILIRILGESTGLNRELNKASGDVDKFARDVEKSARKISVLESAVTGFIQGLGQAAFNATANLVRRGVDEIGKTIDAASDLNETLARTNAVYGENATEVVAWSRTTARSLGVAQEAALSATGTLGNMFQQLGFSGTEAATFGKSLVEASADIVAFHNVSEGVPSVLNDIQSAFRGEYDPIQKYIPLINAATVAQQALAETGKESADQLTAGEKAAAAYTLIVEGMGKAAGAAAREIDSAASQQRIWNARMEEARANIGQVGLVIQQEFYTRLNELLDNMGFYGENIVQQLVVGLTKGLVAITPFLAQLRGVFVSVLKPGSPPKLLPELNDWGKAAAEEYLKGWTLADGSTLETLGSTIENALRSFAGAGRLKATDLVERVFGSSRSIVNAINEWRTAGSVSVATLDAIRRAAGPAGDSVTGLVSAYFNLQEAANKATEAQRQLNEVSQRYDAALSPLQRKLDALQDKQQEIRDNQRLAELGEVISDPTADVGDRQLARLEAQEIQLRQQIGAIEDERDAAIDAEQQKIDAVEQERKAKEEAYNQQQAILNQQVEANRLLAEEIALRERIAGEALAAQEKAARELEAARAKEAAELERNAAAYLRYQLATTDTAGQLAILQAELAKTTEGSAAYWSILTQIAGLEEKLASEGSGGGGIIQTIADTGAAAVENQQYLEDFREALRGATDALFGTDGQQVELTPFWAGVAGTIRDIAAAAVDAGSVLRSFFDFLSGKTGDAGSTSDILRPTYGTGLFGQIYTTVTNAIANLELLREGGWKAVWAKYRTTAEQELKKRIEDGDEEGAFLWEQMIEIGDFIKALGEGDWKTAWEIFTEPPREAIQSILDKITELLNLEEHLQNFMDKFGFPTNPFDNSGPGNPSTPGQDLLPNSPNASYPGVTPDLAGALALASAGPSMINSGNTITIGPLQITVPPGASATETGGVIARSIDEELRSRGWAPT